MPETRSTCPPNPLTGPLGCASPDQSIRGVWTYARTDLNGGYCSYIFSSPCGPDESLTSLPAQSNTACPQNSNSQQDGQCRCDIGYTSTDGRVCIPAPGSCLSKKGSPACGSGQCVQFFKPPEKASGGLVCDAQCTAAGNMLETGTLSDGSGYAIYTGAVYTGVACTPTPTGSGAAATTSTSPAPAPQRPPPGKCPGQINGVDVFVDCSTTSTTSTSSTTRTSGSGTATQSSTDTSSTNTQCSGGRCTTTTTTTPGSSSSGSSGSSPTSTTTSQDQSSFCKDNPTSPQCKAIEQSTFGGSCAGAFVCTGDAAMCAAAKGANETRCALKPLETDANNATVQLGNTSATGQNPSDHPRNNKESRSIGTFDQTNPFSASGVSDMSISVMGSNVVIPLSSLNSTLQALGQLLVALTMLCSALWLIKG